MAENNQNEPTYDVDSHIAKKGRLRTYVLKDLKGKESVYFPIFPPEFPNVLPGELNVSSLEDKARINLFENNYAGHPLNKNYSYDNFISYSNLAAARFLKAANEPSANGEYYHIRAHKIFTKPNKKSYNFDDSGQMMLMQKYSDIEVLLPKNQIDLGFDGVGPKLDETIASWQPTYYDSSSGLSYDYSGEYYPNDGALPFMTINNSLVNLPYRTEYIYFVSETPAANDVDTPDFLLPLGTDDIKEKLSRNFVTPSHMLYVLGLGGGHSGQVKQNIQDSPAFQNLSQQDKNFVNSSNFTLLLGDVQNYYFDNTSVLTHMDFIVNIPFSPKMVKASGLSTEKMLTANISSEFNFMPPQLADIVSSNNFLELELPNFYNFITALVAVQEQRFDPGYANARRLSLSGRIDPSQLLLVGRQYDDYQAFSQLPPGHAHWDYENNKSLADTDLNVEGVDYWQAWSANWMDYNNQKAELPSDQYLQIIKTILIPYENTNFLTEYNDYITYFPQYNRIEFDAPEETPILPQLLKSAKADKYIMRCLAGNLEQDINNTISLTGIESQGGAVEARLESLFQQNRDSPPGEEADLSLDLEELDTNFYTPPGGSDILSDSDLKSWDLSDLINGFKQGSEGWAGSSENISEFDHSQVFYVGIDVEDGYPFPDDLSVGTSNQKFTKSIYAYVLEQQLQQLAAQKILSYAGIQCGSKNYSEVVMYRIHKKNTNDVNGETEQNIWMWNTGDIERYVYYDTQIGYGQSYQYKVYAYYLVIGNRYMYDTFNPGAPIPKIGFGSDLTKFEDPNSLDKAAVEVKIMNQVMMKIVEVPYYGHEETSQNAIVSTDNPPVPPSVNIVPFKNVPDAISMTLTSNSGEFETNKVITLLSERPEAREYSGGPITNYLYASDLDVLEQMYKSQNKVDNMDLKPSLKFKSDTLPAFYEVFRIGPEPGEAETKPPTSYASFLDKLHTVIEVDGSSETIIDDIKENTVYYYTFRSRDGASGYFFSNPTAVYKVELVRETGKNIVYPIIEIYDMEMDKKYRMPSKQMTKYMHIKPVYDHTVFNEGEEELDSLAQFHDKTTINPGDIPHVPKLGVNNDNYELFSITKNNAKRFKIRLTSKSTGRKIDFNVAFLRKHNQD